MSWKKRSVMVNYDMIGWLRDDNLTIFGAGTSPEFKDVFAAANEGLGLELNEVPSSGGGSDHLPFNAKQIPNMFIHTGLTDTYHTPDDDYETLNMEGAVKVIDFSEKVVWGLANLESRPTYQRSQRRRRPAADEPPAAASGNGYLGVQMKEDDSEGVQIETVIEGSAAIRGGIRAGDQVVSIDGKDIKSNEAMVQAIGGKNEGDEVEVVVKRGETNITMKIKLGKRDE